MVAEPHKKFTKKRVALLAGVVLLLVVIGLLVANHDSTPMPVYNGKTAREWFISDGALNAFPKMGSNAVPFLVHELERKDSVFERAYQWTYARLPNSMSRHLSWHRGEEERWYSAGILLEVMWPADSRTAIPALLPILAKGHVKQQACVLTALEPLVKPRDTNCVPALMNCLKSKSLNVRLHATAVLEQMKLEKLAVPALVPFVENKKANVRLATLETLVRIDTSNSDHWHGILTNDAVWQGAQQNKPYSAVEIWDTSED